MANLNKPGEQQQNSLKCEICDKGFKRNDNLKKHFTIVHELMKEYQCNSEVSDYIMV